ncbi:WYL domain-containing protein [Pseudonocardia sp. KRD-184]|uniref:WYL domain-containing protein n=1 Tax=Pseudonocardia oceani TaxID=2792013 RepID=A0ABS6UAP8_9PSEU|nr:WYL domain-containing protein [Pseudonocardia oceani]MBW0089486.1 WYL domain-containing protein [Pseudonocardia oceani]MBW0096479.1 WYL domain-containing protein [Pseudonocardia oceani]MBW0109431.1 WYL domain-containing protein [Pseudonocardia oceani]MBW0123323.1 WYL domain-containing protein [Pseudonocardia oceani]MBW0129300.1 WYL domain-containing protein [Pseudonocardia oceani]
MLETSVRLLELLSLLQVRRDWTSAELAARLGVSTRTVRTDVGKLRTIGYPVDARPGVAGGYRLVAGTAMPPLLLDDDEAVAVAVGLGAVATQRLGVEETSLTALAKLEQVLPSRLRRRVEAVRGATSIVPGASPPLDLAALGAVAAAIRAHERLRFGYTKARGGEGARHVEPQRLVCWGPLWYLLAWDLDRDDWRVFRVDRMVPRAPTGVRFRPRVLADDAAVEFVVGRVIRAGWTFRARVLVHAPAAAVAAKIVIPVDVEVVDEATCRVELGADDPDRLALLLTQLGVDIEVVDGDELAAAFDRLATRFRRAAGGVSRRQRYSAPV